MGLPWPFALRRTPAAAQAPGQAGSGCSRALFGQPLAALCGEDGSLPQPIQEMLAVLHKEGPSTEGIFRRAAGGTEFRELREALDHGADVDLSSQPALLLAVILKDFLRSIPAKLLVTDLYEDWMAAMHKSGKEEKVEELKAVAEKLPGANLLLLKRLLALLQHISHNASSSRMTASNLAICLGPNLLNLHLEEQSGPAGRADKDHQAEALLHTPPASLLDILKEAGGDAVVESETAERPFLNRTFVSLLIHEDFMTTARLDLDTTESAVKELEVGDEAGPRELS
ncbi:T-cell activation Rho GTPase-activating protein-like [Haliaeetus albicilla]|uniref:T-cell activation Rho GTPase-activating protein-like n=1 Tax=Haliaeetus albicilla TaxID=8969 RepID=UPI0037E717BA